MTNRIGAFILAGVLGVPAVVAAGPIGIYGASASAFTSVSTKPVLDNDGEVTTDNFLLTASASSTSGSAQWIASANASASYNELLDVFGLHAFAQALDMSPTSPEDFVSASAAAQWDETILITSDTLAIGAPTFFSFRMGVDAGFTAASCDGSVGNGSAIAGGSARFVNLSGTTDTFTGLNLYPCQANAEAVPLLIPTFVGDTLIMQAKLGVGATSRSGMFTADASHTMTFFLDPVTAGASYTTASGYTYFSPVTPTDPAPVPEPASLALMLSGGAGLAVRRWRRK